MSSLRRRFDSRQHLSSSFSTSDTLEQRLLLSATEIPVVIDQLENSVETVDSQSAASIGQFQNSSIIGLTKGHWWFGLPATDGNYVNSFAGKTPTSDIKVVLPGDFNGDAIQDIAILGNDGRWFVGISTNEGTLSFAKWTEWRTTGIKEIHVGDFNGDGIDDIIGLFQTGTSGSWWVGESTGTRFRARYYEAYSDYHGIVTTKVGNFDGIQGDDIAILNDAGRWWVAQSQGLQSQFDTTAWLRWDLSRTIDTIEVGDFNGDSRDDLLGLFRRPKDFTNRDVIIGVSNGSGFTNQRWQIITASKSLNYFFLGDFDGDSNTDIAVFVNNFRWLVGLSNGTDQFDYQDWGVWSDVITYKDLAVGETNQDGSSDIIGRATDGMWHSLESTGTGFTSRTLVKWSNTVNWSHVIIDDFYLGLVQPVDGNFRTSGIADTESTLGELLLNAKRWSQQAVDESDGWQRSAWDQVPLSTVSRDEEFKEFAEDDLVDLLSLSF